MKTTNDDGRTVYVVETDDLTIDQLVTLLHEILDAEPAYRTARMVTASGACSFGGTIELTDDNYGQPVLLLE